MVLVTGASGKTGRAVIAALAARGVRVRAFVRRPEAAAGVLAAGAQEASVGDMLIAEELRAACRGVAAVYHICPNMHTGEVAMAEALLGAMAQAGVGRLVYHSVLHPQVEGMPHHWRKLRVEELLFTRDVQWTILQPAAYMQNVFAYWRAIVEEGVYRVPYAVTARLGMVDLEDVAAAAAVVLQDPAHEYAIYELAGREILDQVQIAAVLAQQIGRPVRAEAINRAEWAENARRAGQSAESVDTLRRMFEYYERYGFYGNPTLLKGLLGREPATFGPVVARQVAGGGRAG
jgi:NAD(P)H dehydrogenase (quinone)